MSYFVFIKNGIRCTDEASAASLLLLFYRRIEELDTTLRYLECAYLELLSKRIRNGEFLGDMSVVYYVTFTERTLQSSLKIPFESEDVSVAGCRHQICHSIVYCIFSKE